MSNWYEFGSAFAVFTAVACVVYRLIKGKTRSKGSPVVNLFVIIGLWLIVEFIAGALIYRFGYR